jgi:hypothetical protein
MVHTFQQHDGREIYVINEVTNWEQRTLYNDRLQQIDLRSGWRSSRTGEGEEFGVLGLGDEKVELVEG